MPLPGIGRCHPARTGGTRARLVSQHKAQPGMLETMFSSHPMSTEHMATAREDAKHCARFLQINRQGDTAKFSAGRLRAMGHAVQ